MDGIVTADTKSGKAVGRFNKNERFELLELFEQIIPLPIASIASVCHTDSLSVELILAEILATVAHQAKNQQHIRLNFKCGWLIIQNGLIQWQHSRELVAGQPDSESTPSQTTKTSQRVSVITPSVARLGRS